MQYQGGKQRLSKDISNVITSYIGEYNRLRYQGGKSRMAKDISAVIAFNAGGQIRS